MLVHINHVMKKYIYLQCPIYNKHSMDYPVHLISQFYMHVHACACYILCM